MSELPESCKQLLDHERAAPAPSQATRARVRERVALAVSAGAAIAAVDVVASAGKSATQGGLLASTSGKLWIAAALSAALGGGGLLLHTTAPRPAAAPVAPARIAAPAVEAPPVQPSAAALPEPASAVGDQQPVVPAASDRAAGQPPRSGAKSTARNVSDADDLRAEMLLLAAASNALERGDVPAARAQLARYRAQFARGQLKEEERGLDAMARCLAQEPGAAAYGSRYLRRAQAGVLAERVAAACKERR